MRFIVILLIGTFFRAYSDSTIIDDFQSGVFQWKSRAKLESVKQEYSVQKEQDNFFLHAAPKPGAEGKIIYRELKIDLKKHSLLKWRWRARVLPVNADEAAGKNDSAAGVYVFFQKGPFRRILKYCWSTSHKGTKWIDAKSSNLFWKTKMKILRQGEPLNLWVTETVNMREDYKVAYGEDPPHKAAAIGVLTDGDQTNSESVADYDDFVLLSALKE